MKLLTFTRAVMHLSVASFFTIVGLIGLKVYMNYEEYEARWYQTFESADRLEVSINRVSIALENTLPVLSTQMSDVNTTMTHMAGTMNGMDSNLGQMKESVHYMAGIVPTQMVHMNQNVGRMRENFSVPGMMKSMFPW